MWNAGLQWWDAGAEQSAIDFGGYRNGSLEVFLTLSAGCVNGSNTAANNASSVGCPTTVPPNLAAVTDNLFTLGANFAKWKTLYTYGIAGNTSGSPAVGNVGEVKTASVDCSAPISMATSTAKSIVTLSLGAGTWDLTGTSGFIGDATTVVTLTQASLSTTLDTADTTVGRITSVPYAAAFAPFATSSIRQSMPTLRVTPTTATDYYLVELALFGTSTLDGCGTLRATRVY